MKAFQFLNPVPKGTLMLGLGVGTVPTIMRGVGIPMDVVELNGPVVDAASKYFDYDAQGNATIIADAHALVLAQRNIEATQFNGS